MDWNQISNYAARHTHTKSRRWGRPGRPAGPCGTPGAVELNARRKVRGQGPSARPPCPLLRPAGSPAGGWGEVSVQPPGQGCALQPEGQPEKGRCRGHRPGRAFRPAARDASCLSPNGSGPSAPTAPPLHSGRAHCALTPCAAPPPHCPPSDGLAGFYMAGPLGAGHSHKQAPAFKTENTHRHLPRIHRSHSHPPRSLFSCPSRPPQPTLLPFVSCLCREEGGGQQPNPGRQGAGREGPSFPT